MTKRGLLVVSMLAMAVAAGCGVDTKVKKLVGLGGDDLTVYKGPVYPAASNIAIAFHPSQVNRSCRVFAQSLVQLPANLTGKDIESSVLAEAGKRGADQLLIGQARQGKDNEGPRFLYYGPAHEYLCAEQCGGWKYGYDIWEKQGAWVGLGLAEWGKTGSRFETPLVMQLAMLRCQ